MPTRLAFVSVLCVIPTVLLACSGFTASDECEPGEQRSCQSLCGPGQERCQPEGQWGVCQPDSEPECLPGDYGECIIGEEDPPGLWLCSDRCEIGPCMALCIPGETFACSAQCGPGQRRCLNDGNWGECRESVLPQCRPGSVERCPDGASHQRCGEDCWWSVCDDGPCTPGEIADCGACASQVCLADRTWSDCTADVSAACSPDAIEDCEAPCGPGRRNCTDSCEWTDCMEIEHVPCHPGDRQICPTTLYCGVAYRVCAPDCDWGVCLETGD